MSELIETPPEDTRPFVVPCRQLRPDAPLRWLRMGWQDVRAEPRLTLIFGGVILLVSLLVSALAWALGRFALLATLLSGFVFVAPLIGVGLYCVAREREAGRVPSISHSFTLACRVAGQAGVFALAQLVVLLLWSRAGMMVGAFFPVSEGNTQHLLEYLLVGSAAGSIFATLTFASMAFSLPMIADRDVDMVTAIVSSINAVLRNKLTLLVWAVLILLLTLIGFATAYIGLVVIMPWLAYSAWHAYTETLDTDGWPRLEGDCLDHG